jgi:hypothetical protein
MDEGFLTELTRKYPAGWKGVCMKELMVYTGPAVIFLWGVGHLIPTRSIVSGFGNLGPENRRILAMEWVAEGLTLCFIGILAALVVFVDGPASPVGRIVVRAAAIMLFIMAGLTALTGARTSIGPMKACPVVKSIVGVLYIAGAWI